MLLGWWSPHPRLGTVAGKCLLRSFLGARGVHILGQLSFTSGDKKWSKSWQAWAPLKGSDR